MEELVDMCFLTSYNLSFWIVFFSYFDFTCTPIFFKSGSFFLQEKRAAHVFLRATAPFFLRACDIMLSCVYPWRSSYRPPFSKPRKLRLRYPEAGHLWHTALHHCISYIHGRRISAAPDGKYPWWHGLQTV